MKKILLITLLLFMSFSLIGCGGKKSVSYGEYEKEHNIDSSSLVEEGYLTVGISRGYSQYLNYKSIDNEFQYYGGEAFLSSYIAQKMGLDLKFVDIKNADLVNDLNKKQYDIALSSLIYDEKYLSDFYVTVSYVETKTFILATNQITNLADAKIGAVSSSRQYSLALEKGKEVVTGANSIALANKLLADEIDCIFVKEAEMNSILKRNEFKNFVKLNETLVDPYDGPVIYGLDEELMDYVQILVEGLDEEQFAAWNEIDFQDKNSFFKTVFKLIDRYGVLLLKGIGITLALSLVTVLLGTVLGVIVTLIRRNKYTGVKFVAASYVEVVRGIPLLLLLWFVYLAAPKWMPSYISVGIALFVNSGAYVAEIIRAGINAVDKGQVEAARSLGMTSGQTMRKIVLPQALRNILPALCNEFVAVIKETSLASVFFVGDLMTVKNQITSLTYLSIEPFVIVAIIYFIMTFGLSKLIAKLERRLNA